MSEEMIDPIKRIKYLEERCKSYIERIDFLNSRLRLYENDFFREAFCAALPCFIDGNLDIDRKVNAKINVEQAILHAQEAVRQVGAMATISNLEAVEADPKVCKKSPDLVHRYKGQLYGNPPCSYCGQLESVEKEEALDS